MDSTPAGSHTDHILIKRRKLVDVIRNSSSRNYKEKSKCLKSYVKKTTGYLQLPNEIVIILSRFLNQFKKMWVKCGRNFTTFQKKKKYWLDGSLSFTVAGSKYGRGRPIKNFSESSERTKRRKTEELRAKITSEELSFATHMSLRASGKINEANVVKDVTQTTPNRALKYREGYENLEKHPCLLSGDKALSMYVEAKLTKHQYNTIRTTMMECEAKILPSYDNLLRAKRRCYPSEVSITETKAEVSLQSLMNHTTERILLAQREVVMSLNSQQLEHLKLYSKWGCDGSSGHSQYKQKFISVTDSDSNIFVTSVVPLQLIYEYMDKKIIVWQNPRPSSPRFCRPIKLEFIRESSETINEEVKNIENQISVLQNSVVIFDNKQVIVSHNLLFTMVDGKVCNAITGTSSMQKCYLCQATPKQFNNIDAVIKKNVEERNLKFGLSVLHAWIRMLECLLHLSYKLSVKKWQIRSAEDKTIVAKTKQNIQEQLRSKLGLLVDIKTKPGCGTRNDGNRARRFFENPEISSSVTGIDEEIIKSFHTILLAISSGYSINVQEFHQFALNTAKKFVQKYPWYYMPVSVHKILIHGNLIISSAILPIGQLSEEAQEARNKDIKKYREECSRKFSRTTIQDIFNLLLISSDPYITSIRKLPKRKFRSLPKDVLLLLSDSDIPPSYRDNIDELPYEDTDEDSDID